jgi:hypothetical protein
MAQDQKSKSASSYTGVGRDFLAAHLLWVLRKILKSSG